MDASLTLLSNWLLKVALQLTWFFFFCRAVGHMTYGSTYREQIVDKLRKAAEHCDCLQSFFIIHSLGGGKDTSKKDGNHISTWAKFASDCFFIFCFYYHDTSTVVTASSSWLDKACLSTLWVLPLAQEKRSHCAWTTKITISLSINQDVCKGSIEGRIPDKVNEVWVMLSFWCHRAVTIVLLMVLGGV